LPLLVNSKHNLSSCADSDDEAYVFEVEKARLTKIQADIQQLKKDKLAGSLVDRVQTEKDFFSVGRIVRDAILDVPARLAAELASTTDIHTVQHRMTQELTTALEALCKDERH
jgi:phage terminase Nu1 subunit (DNA packaging protein)